MRIGCVGVTGSGKSWALRRIVAAAQHKLGVAYIHDDSDDAPAWGGQRRIDLADCKEHPLHPRDKILSPNVVLEGDVFAERKPSIEDSAADAWRLAHAGHSCAIVADELRRACKGQKWTAGDDGPMARIAGEGRKAGLSFFWATTDPQDVPRSALSQSDLLIFLLDGREVSYLIGLGILSREQESAVRTLKVGDFMVRRLGHMRTLDTYRF